MLGSLIAIVGGSVFLSGALLCAFRMRQGPLCVLSGLVMLGTGLVLRRFTGEAGWLGGHWWSGALLGLLIFLAMIAWSITTATREGLNAGPDRYSGTPER